MFESLTRYLEILKDGDYGEFIPPEKDENGVYVLHGFQYSKDVDMLEQDVYSFAEKHPKFNHTKYSEILDENGIDLQDPSLFKNKLQNLDPKIVFIVLSSLIRAEHLCEGAIMSSLKEGKIQECLKALRDSDNVHSQGNVKEISIVSNFAFMQYSDYWYKDFLRISEHWVSYRRNDFKTGEIRSEWIYKSSKKNRIWEHLTETAIFTYNRCKPWNFVTDCGSLNLRITFKNGEHWDLELSSDFAFNEMKELALLIKKMIPSEETEYPDVLNIIPLFLCNYEMTRENLKDLKKEDVCVLMYAEGGAMGSPGEVCVIDTNGTKYSTGGIYSNDGCDISQGEVIDAFFDGLEHRSGSGAPDFDNCRINNSHWVYVNLGMGNHLYLRRDFWVEHGIRIMAMDPAERYTKWKDLIKER